MTSEELKYRFGRRIQTLREARGLTQEQLAAKVGRSVDTLSNIERGINATRIETAGRLAVELGVDLPELFAFQDRGTITPPVEQPKEVAEILALLDGLDPPIIAKICDLVRISLSIATLR